MTDKVTPLSAVNPLVIAKLAKQTNTQKEQNSAPKKKKQNRTPRETGKTRETGKPDRQTGGHIQEKNRMSNRILVIPFTKNIIQDKQTAKRRRKKPTNLHTK